MGGVKEKEEGPAAIEDPKGWVVVIGWEGDKPHVGRGMGVEMMEKGVEPRKMGMKLMGI